MTRNGAFGVLRSKCTHASLDLGVNSDNGFLGAMKWILLVVLVAVVGLVASVQRASRQSDRRTAESVLIQNLWTLRAAVDEYILDKKSPPRALEELVQEHYLRLIPIDPMTRSDSTWRLAPKAGGSVDVKSGSTETGLDGRKYSEW